MNKTSILFLYSFGHFITDFSCLYFAIGIFAQLYPHHTALGFLFYNFFAFALQFIIGYFFDKYTPELSTSIGIGFLLIGFVTGFCGFSFPGLIICAIGNAFFHVGGVLLSYLPVYTD